MLVVLYYIEIYNIESYHIKLEPTMAASPPGKRARSWSSAQTLQASMKQRSAPKEKGP